MNNLNSSVTSNNTEALNGESPTSKVLGLGGVSPEFFQILKELTPQMPNLFHEIDIGGKLLNYSYEVVRR